MALGGIRSVLESITPYLLFIIAITTLGPLQFGFHLAELNAPEDVLTCRVKANKGVFAEFKDKFQGGGATRPSECIPMNDAQFAVVSSIFTLGGLLGALCAGPLSTKKGRLWTMRIVTIFYIVGSVLEAVAASIAEIAGGRLLSGVGAGAALVVVPLYIAEVAPPKERGLFGVMTQITINVGIVITQTMGYLLNKGAQWRIVLATGAGIAVLNVIGLFFVPESPAWLSANNNSTKGDRILKRIRGRDINTDATDSEEYSPSALGDSSAPLLRDSTAQPLSPGIKPIPNVGFIQVVRDPLYRPAIIAVIGAMFAQQCTGINSVIMYSVSLLSDLFPQTAGLLAIFLSVANLVMTILCAPLSDKLGRKLTLLISIAGMGTSSLCLAFSILFGVQILSAISVLCFILSFALGLGPIPFILASELVGQEAKGATQSWALASNWIFTFLVAEFFPILNKLLNEKLGGQGWVYFIFAALALVSGLFVAFRVPETRGKKDADEVWGRVRRD